MQMGEPGLHLCNVLCVASVEVARYLQTFADTFRYLQICASADAKGDGGRRGAPAMAAARPTHTLPCTDFLHDRPCMPGGRVPRLRAGKGGTRRASRPSGLSHARSDSPTKG
jgi:hypothetical protein